MIITLEGVDGCGKGTQAKILSARLSEKDKNTGLMKFPEYTSPLGHLILDFLQGKAQIVCQDGARLPQSVAQALGFQALAQANKLEFAPMVEAYADKGYLVLDRYWHSAIPYGCAADGLDEKYMQDWADLLPQSHVNILIDVPADVAIKRQLSRGLPLERYEGQFEKLHIIRRSYMKLWKHRHSVDPDHWFVVDGTLSVEALGNHIWNAVRHGEMH